MLRPLSCTESRGWRCSCKVGVVQGACSQTRTGDMPRRWGLAGPHAGACSGSQPKQPCRSPWSDELFPGQARDTGVGRTGSNVHLPPLLLEKIISISPHRGLGKTRDPHGRANSPGAKENLIQALLPPLPLGTQRVQGDDITLGMVWPLNTTSCVVIRGKFSVRDLWKRCISWITALVYGILSLSSVLGTRPGPTTASISSWTLAGEEAGVELWCFPCDFPLPSMGTYPSAKG